LALRLDDTMAGRMKEWANQSVILGIRPEDIAQRTVAPDAPPAQTVEAVVEAMQPTGAESYLNLTGMAQPFVARVPAAVRVRALERVSLVFDMAQAHFFDPVTERTIG
jgi:multiple sugar transport system ATP-binding protein